MARSVERDLGDAQRAAQSGIRELLARHEAKVITRMVTAYRSNKLTAEDAKVGVAVVSELRSLGGDVARDIERGRQAAESLTR